MKRKIISGILLASTLIMILAVSSALAMVALNPTLQVSFNSQVNPKPTPTATPVPTPVPDTYVTLTTIDYAGFPDMQATISNAGTTATFTDIKNMTQDSDYNLIVRVRNTGNGTATINTNSFSVTGTGVGTNFGSPYVLVITPNFDSITLAPFTNSGDQISWKVHANTVGTASVTISIAPS